MTQRISGSWFFDSSTGPVNSQLGWEPQVGKVNETTKNKKKKEKGQKGDIPSNTNKWWAGASAINCRSLGEFL